MAFHESTVLLCVSGESVEGGTHIALFIALKMLSHVVTEERVQQVQLEVIFLVKLLTGYSLGVCVVFVLVAFVGESVQKLLLPLQS